MGAQMQRGAYSRVCRSLDGVSTRCSGSGWRRAGRPDEPRHLQASLRGCDAERCRSAGLLGDRTHSESNGCSGDSMTGPASRLRNQRLTMYDACMSDTPKYRNRLLQDTSPYLLQHAHNPVDWYPWGEAALARAKAENKPILLSIGYSACPWCHVMERESFENPD